MKITIRADTVTVEGYVNAVGRDSRLLVDDMGYPYREQVQPGTFAKALNAKIESSQEIRLLLNHRTSRVLGGTDSNLELSEDSIGLYAKAEITDPEVMQKARDGKLTGWSFGFIELDHRDEWGESGHRVIVTDMDLREVTICDEEARPAYAGTSIKARADGVEEKLQTRTMDADVLYRVEKEPEKPAEKRPDYSAYESAIAKLRR